MNCHPLALDAAEYPTGITTEAEITGPNASSIVPDFVTQSIGDLRAVPR
jgi:4-nitrophenyl phosphatase